MWVPCFWPRPGNTPHASKKHLSESGAMTGSLKPYLHKRKHTWADIWTKSSKSWKTPPHTPSRKGPLRNLAHPMGAEILPKFFNTRLWRAYWDKFQSEIQLDLWGNPPLDIQSHRNCGGMTGPPKHISNTATEEVFGCLGSRLTCHSLGFASALMLGKKFNKNISLKWWFSSHGTIGQKIRWKTCSSKFCGIKKFIIATFLQLRPLFKLGLSSASLKYCHFRERSIFPPWKNTKINLIIIDRSFSDRQTHHHKFISSDFGTAGIQGCCIIQGL